MRGTPRVAALVLIGLSILWLVLSVAIPASNRLTNGFSAYYTAAQLVQEGVPAVRFYDDEWFRDQTIRHGFWRAPDVFNLNPPSAALLLWPLSFLDPISAKQAWTWFSVACLGLAGAGLVAVGLASKRTTESTQLEAGWSAASTLTRLAITFALIGFFQPVAEGIRQGQSYALLLLVEVGFVWSYVRRRDGWAGVTLSALIAVKLSALSFPLMLVVQRRWRILVWTILGVALIVISTAALLGASAWVTYVDLLLGSNSHPEIAVTAYQSVPGFLAHAFRRDDRWNPEPVLDLAWLATPLTLIVAGALVGFTAWRAWRVRDKNPASVYIVLAAWSLLSVVLNPFAADYHYTLAVLPAAFLLADRMVAKPVDSPGLAAVIVGILAIGAPWPNMMLTASNGVIALVAYPRLYGALILWIVAMSRLARPGLRQSRG